MEAVRVDAARLRDALRNPPRLEGPGRRHSLGALHETERRQGPRSGRAADCQHPARRQVGLAGRHGVRGGGLGRVCPAQGILAVPARLERHGKDAKRTVMLALRASSLPSASTEGLVRDRTDQSADRVPLIKEAVGTDDTLAQPSCLGKELADIVFPRYATSRVLQVADRLRAPAPPPVADLRRNGRRSVDGPRSGPFARASRQHSRHCVRSCANGVWSPAKSRSSSLGQSSGGL